MQGCSGKIHPSVCRCPDPAFRSLQIKVTWMGLTNIPCPSMDMRRFHIELESIEKCLEICAKIMAPSGYILRL